MGIGIKIGRERYDELRIDLTTTDLTLDQLGAKWGVTRERIRQLAKKLGVHDATAIRSAKRVAKTRNDRVVHERFNEAYNAVWRKAEDLGYEVKAYADHLGAIKTTQLFINRRHVWVSWLRAPHATVKGARIYWGTNRGTNRGTLMASGTRVFVCDHEGRREFYIFLLGTKIPRYIPAVPLVRQPNRHNAIDVSAHKEAWHLLA